MIFEVKIKEEHVKKVKVVFKYHAGDEATECLIFMFNPSYDEWSKMSTGIARKNFSDKSDRRIGRKIAFRKALSGFISRFDIWCREEKRIRSVFWQQYIWHIRLPHFKKVEDQRILLVESELERLEGEFSGEEDSTTA